MINSKINIIKYKEKPSYPYIGVNGTNSKVYVLFHKENTGIVIKSDYSSWKEGEYSTTWSEFTFTAFDGEITLSNKKD